jgi:hypothetical protein
MRHTLPITVYYVHNAFHLQFMVATIWSSCGPVACPVFFLFYHKRLPNFQLVSEQGAADLMAVKGNQPRLHRQIKDQFRFRRQFPVEISQSESGHDRSVTWTLRAMEATDVIRESWPESSWIIELHSTGSRVLAELPG